MITSEKTFRALEDGQNVLINGRAAAYVFMTAAMMDEIYSPPETTVVVDNRVPVVCLPMELVWREGKIFSPSGKAVTMEIVN